MHTVLTGFDNRHDGSESSPHGIEAVHGAYDFRAAHKIGDLFIDHCFGGLEGQWEVHLTNDEGQGVSLSSDTPWLQLHTADALRRPAWQSSP